MNQLRPLIDRLEKPNGWVVAVLWYACFASLAFMPLDQFTGLRIAGILNVVGAMVAAVPLLLLAYTPDYDNRAGKPQKRLMPWVYLALLLWNVLTTWWIWNSTIGGSIAAFTINALLQLLPWWAFRVAQRRANLVISLTIWTIAQVVWEYLHMNWDLSWSWLNLGNSLAFIPELAQHYAYIGTLGGSFWLWSIQALLALQLIKSWNKTSEPGSFVLPNWLLMGWIAVPMTLSLVLYSLNNPDQGIKQVGMLALQPNVDPYTEKYSGGMEGAMQQVNRMMAQTDSALKPETELILWPETSIPYPIMIDESQTDAHPVVAQLKAWLAAHPEHKNLTLLAGINTYKFIDGAQPGPDGRIEPEVYNTAIFIRSGKPTVLYHKSKLVPGVEQLPYPEVFNFLSSLAIDLGGTVGSLGKQQERTVFSAQDTSGYVIAPIICYESIYGDFVKSFTRNGANVLGIITNDAWWGQTNGHRQHWAYARLRAIENNRWVVRSANTGISGIINSRGDVIMRTDYNQKAVVTSKIWLRK